MCVSARYIFSNQINSRNPESVEPWHFSNMCYSKFSFENFSKVQIERAIFWRVMSFEFNFSYLQIEFRSLSFDTRNILLEKLSIDQEHKCSRVCAQIVSHVFWIECLFYACILMFSKREVFMIRMLANWRNDRNILELILHNRVRFLMFTCVLIWAQMSMQLIIRVKFHVAQTTFQRKLRSFRHLC
jgi:hypothetical protein